MQQALNDRFTDSVLVHVRKHVGSYSDVSLDQSI